MEPQTRLRPPSPPIPERQLPFLPALRRMMDNPIEGWPRAVYEQLIYVPPRRDFRTIYVLDPRVLKTVLLDEVANFPKSPLSQRLLTPMLGSGLLTAELGEWRWQRRAAAPAFRANDTTFKERVAEIVSKHVRTWRDGQTIDAMSAMSRLTFEIILETMLGGAAAVDADEMGRQFATYMESLGRPSLADILGAPPWLRTLASRDGGRSVRFMREAVDAMIAARRKGPARDDLVQLLLDARDRETGRSMTDAELRDNLLTFLAAGHETTALALTWSLYLASLDRTCARRIRGEAEAAHNAPHSIAGDGLSYTRNVVREAMRLYPPVPVLTRACASATRLGGHEVRKGDIVVVPIYALHRHRTHWRDPDYFEPERFNDMSADRLRYIYAPFGAGPRVCIGAAFALTEATIVLGEIMRQVSLSCLCESVRPLQRITLRPEGGLPMRVSRTDDRATRDVPALVH